ncbi:MAG: hypothetical protein ABC595_03820 [Candidatus Methanosuratincola petrocarbonis]
METSVIMWIIGILLVMMALFVSPPSLWVLGVIGAISLALGAFLLIMRGKE